MAVQAKNGYDIRTGFAGLLDNREYFNSVQIPQTFFGGRIEADLGFYIDSININSTHFVRAGFTYFQEFGSKPDSRRPELTAFYNYHGSNSIFYMGSFPRDSLLHYPRMYLSDSILYFRPNIQGGFYSIFNKYFCENVWVDWTSRQTNTERETFLFGFSGRFQKSAFFIDHYFMMFHFAGPAIRIPGDHVRDNGGAALIAGYHIGMPHIIDSIEVSAGFVSSFDRYRGLTNWNVPVGAIATFHIEKYGFGITGHAYKGKGHNLFWGDTFYKAGSYGRLDLSYTPKIKVKQVHTSFTLGLHFIDKKVDFSQYFYINMTLQKPLHS